ncbi:MAG: amylo-alpha-1,6-glucosidase [Phycisphaerae bacterium]
MTNVCPSAKNSLLCGDMETLLAREWLITNKLGSYASSTVINCHTRRYHGLLVSANIPPLGRIVTVNNFFERLVVDGVEHHLGNFEFNGAIYPEGHKWQTSFQRQIEDDLSNVSFVYQVDDVTFIRTLWLFADHNTALMYWLAVDGKGMRPLRIAIHPLVAMRDFHSLRRQSAGHIFDTRQMGQTLHLQVPAFGADKINKSYDLYLTPTGLRGPVKTDFTAIPDWWFNFRYRVEAERGQDCGEDLYMPGFFEIHGQGRAGFGLWLDTEGLSEHDLDKLLTRVNYHLQSAQGPLTIVEEVSSTLAASITSTSDNPLNEPVETTLRKAAMQFSVRRKDLNGKDRCTILAGYPWFGDWGRDTFISLPGLLLATGRYEQALETLQLFGSAESDGLIPNRFDDYGGEPEYNTVDASLWFIIAADEYIRTSGDTDSWKKFLQKVCLKIVESYIEGTKFDIKVDPTDGLLWAGNDRTQLTWMDAMCANTVFTPRWGKPVEINALWYNALKIVSSRLDGRKKKLATELAQLADKAEENFQKKFWYPDGEYLFDCVRDDCSDPTIRPNQIYAVSLRHSPLRINQQIATVECVRRHLLTPYGLRTLAPTNPNYKGIYNGDQFQRDRAYHQGTVWAFLIGPFIEAYLKVNNYSAAAATTAQDYLKPLLDNLYEAGIGTLGEIFDGDPPHKPRGCIAQAWSVAEVIRAQLAIKQSLEKKSPKEKKTTSKV